MAIERLNSPGHVGEGLELRVGKVISWLSPE